MGNLYKYKNLNHGFIILCPDLNIGHLKNTITSIGVYYPDAKVIAVLPENCKKEDLNVSKKTYAGGTTIASMINTGMKNASQGWHFIIFSKGWVRGKVDIKYSYFVENEQDILFPIVNRKLNFDQANGMFINKTSFQDIGDFPDTNSLDTSKLLWANKAIEKGYKFKGIVGGRIF